MRFVFGGITGLCLLGASCLVPATALFDPVPASSVTSAMPAAKESTRPVEEEPTTAESARGFEQLESPPLLDTWSLAAREDGSACRDALESAGFKFRAYADKEKPDKSGCGIPHAVVVFRGPTGITYDPPITVDCSLARALESVERIVQEEAESHLRSRIARIGNLGGYACRPPTPRRAHH